LSLNGLETKIRYYDNSNINDLHDAIARGEVIQNCFINTTDSIGDAGKIVFENCIIKEIRFRGDSSKQAKIQAVDFNNSHIEQLSFSYCQLQQLSVSQCDLQGIYIFGSEIVGAFSYDCTEETLDEEQRCSLTNSKFGLASLSIAGKAIIEVNQSQFKQLYIDRNDCASMSDPAKVQFVDGQYEKLSLRLCKKIQYNFFNLAVEDTLELRDREMFEDDPNTDSIATGNFNELHFAEGSVLNVDYNAHLNKIGLSIDALSSVRINYQWYHDGLSENDLDKIRRNFDNMKYHIKELQTTDDELRDQTLAWLDYQQLSYRKKYLWENLSFGNLAELFWLGILEVTVRSGYKGEFNFVLCVAIVMSVWAFLYFSYFRTEVDTYITDGSPKSRPFRVFMSSRKKMAIEYFKCLWFSFMVLINPKFPTSYFAFSPSMLIWVIVEWTVGVFLLILFIVYILTKYPFVKTLLGI
jgi:hypothetical protein